MLNKEATDGRQEPPPLRPRDVETQPQKGVSAMKRFCNGLNTLLILFFVTTCLQGCDLLGGNSTNFDGGTRLVLTPENIDEQQAINSILEQTANVINLRLDNYGVRNKDVKIVKDNKIEILIPKVKNIERVMNILTRKGYVELRFVDKTTENNSTSQQDKQSSSPISNEAITLEPEVLLDNSMIKDVDFRISSETNKPYLQLIFNDIGTKKLFEVTSKGIGRRMAIIMDGQILGSPVIREAISGGKAMVTLPFSEEEAKDLQIVLNSGSYPVKMNILEVSNIPQPK